MFGGENLKDSFLHREVKCVMVTQREYDTNMRIVYDAMGLDDERILPFLHQQGADVWGPAKEYALQKPTGRPFISKVLHFKQKLRANVDLYTVRMIWYAFLSSIRYVRVKMSDIEIVERQQHYAGLLQQDPEWNRDNPEKLCGIDFYYNSASGKEIQVIYTKNASLPA